MTLLTTPPRRIPCRPMVQWVFRRDTRAVTCEVDICGRGEYSVRLVPHWDAAAGITERFTRSLDAMERHAAIARQLRASGWVVADHAIPNHVAVAA